MVLKRGVDVTRKPGLTIIAMLLFGSISGQDILPDSLVLYSGYVLSAVDSSGIPNTHILNLTRGTGTVSSGDGSFGLHVHNLDTLKFSCIGLESVYFFINTNVQRPELLVYLKQDTIMMKEIRVSPLPPRRFFRYVFLNTKLPEPEEPKLNLGPMLTKDPGYVPPTGIIFTGPVQALYNAFNKKARLDRKLRKNREKYSKYLDPVVGDSLVFPK